MDRKSRKNSPKIDANIDAIVEGPLKRFWFTLGCFWDLGLSKMSVSYKQGAHFQEFGFFMLELIFPDFVTFWDALGSHFGIQNGVKMVSKFDQKIE